MPDMSNALMLIGATGDRPIHLIFGQEVGDHQPYVVITITPEYVAHKLSKQLPLAPSEFARFINDNARALMNIAASCRDSGKTGVVLTAKLSKAPHNLICTLDQLRELDRSRDQPPCLGSEEEEQGMKLTAPSLAPDSLDQDVPAGADPDDADHHQPAAVLTDQPA